MRPAPTKWEESRQERIGDMDNLNSQKTIENKEIYYKSFVVTFLLHMLHCHVIYQFKA